MSLTNDQITAKNFKEFYEAIRPYLNGSFPTTIANKFDKANMYSTDEQIVGRWIDGKPLYQKTVDCGALPNNTTKEIAHNVTNAEMMRIVDAFAFSSGNTIPIPFTTTKTIESISIEVQKVGNVKIACAIDYSGFSSSYVIIQYTKASDSPIDIGSDTDYSTTEKIIGTWIDGKPLYQKTLQVSITNRNTWIDTGFDATNVSIKNVLGVDILPHGVIQSPIGGGIVHDHGAVTVYNAMNLEIRSNKLSIYYDRTSSETPSYPFTYTFTIQYTKTTD